MNLPSKERMAELCEECDAWCCRYVLDKLDNADTHKPKYWKAVKYQKVRAVEWWEDGKWIRFAHDCPCAQLDQETGKCKIYDTRPDVCRLFPTKLHQNSGWRTKCKIIQEINKSMTTEETQRRKEYGDL